MYKWDRASRDSTTNATVSQVQTAITFLHEWLAQSFGEDSVRVTSLDENHKHYSIDVIGSAKAMSIPMYIGTNCAKTQIVDQNAMIETLKLLLSDPGVYGKIEGDDASGQAILADVKWFMEMAEAIADKIAHERQISGIRADLSL